MKSKLADEVVCLGEIAGRVIGVLISTDAKTATKYLDPKFVVKATHQRKPGGRDRGQHIIVSFGRPNYLERKFIKDCKRAGEPFPVRKIQLRPWPKRRVA